MSLKLGIMKNAQKDRILSATQLKMDNYVTNTALLEKLVKHIPELV